MLNTLLLSLLQSFTPYKTDNCFWVQNVTQLKERAKVHSSQVQGSCFCFCIFQWFWCPSTAFYSSPPYKHTSKIPNLIKIHSAGSKIKHVSECTLQITQSSKQAHRKLVAECMRVKMNFISQWPLKFELKFFITNYNCDPICVNTS